MEEEAKTREEGKRPLTPHDGYDFHISGDDVTDYADFGSFEVLKTERGIMFRDYTGYHIWCEPYIVGADGKATKTTLYQWLENAMLHRKLLSGEDPLKPYAGEFTNADVLDYEKIVTEATLVFPKVAFLDVSMAGLFAHLYIKWLDAMQKKLVAAMEAPGASESETLAVEAEEKARIEYGEQSDEFLKRMCEVLEGLTSGGGKDGQEQT